jgi:repressor LexA
VVIARRRDDVSAVPLTRRQREIVEFIEAYRHRRGISPTLEEIAQQFGVNRVTIFGHVAELERKGVLARARRGVSRSLQVKHAIERPRARIPLVGVIAAGEPIEAVEQGSEIDLIDVFPNDGDVYALRVKGDSMIGAAICDGDLAIVARDRAVCDGDIVVAVLPGEEATLKRYYRDGEGVRLQPANPAMQPIVVHEVEVRGVLIGVVRRL